MATAARIGEMTHSLEGRATRFGSDRLINSERLTSRSLRRSATGCQQVRDITSRDGELAEPGRLITLPAAHECPPPRVEAWAGAERFRLIAEIFESSGRGLGGPLVERPLEVRWKIRTQSASPAPALGLRCCHTGPCFPHPHPVAR